VATQALGLLVDEEKMTAAWSRVAKIHNVTARRIRNIEFNLLKKEKDFYKQHGLIPPEGHETFPSGKIYTGYKHHIEIIQEE
jgi:hypothetical protein